MRFETPARTVAEARRAGRAWLVGQRDPDGAWRDFALDPGESDEWVTAYVAASLAACGEIDVARQAWVWLAGRGSPGWGYNAGTPDDADSTAWALRLADAVGAHDTEAAHRGRALLRRHRARYGVATYRDPDAIRAYIGAPLFMPVTGWLRGHDEVTAAAATLRDVDATLLEDLRRRQRANGSWRSYWWFTDAYATSLAVDALVGPGEADRRARAWSWARPQGRDRAGTPMARYGSAFTTALTLLVAAAAGAATSREARLLLDRLLHAQRLDGSWAGDAALRVPPPNFTDPEQYRGWRLGGKVEGAVTTDQRSRFTTATVLRTLTAVEGAPR